MNAIETVLRQPAAQATAWALLQFVWQGAAIGVLTALALLALRRSASDVRYVVASIGLALMLTLPVVSGVQRFQSLRGDPSVGADVTHRQDGRAPIGPAREHVNGARDAAAAVTLNGVPRALWIDRVQAVRIEPLLPVLMLVWLLGVAALSLRLLAGWLWVQRLRTHGVSDASDACRRMAARLSRRLHIARAVT